jgi:hypothetical protein
MARRRSSFRQTARLEHHAVSAGQRGECTLQTGPGFFQFALLPENFAQVA